MRSSKSTWSSSCRSSARQVAAGLLLEQRQDLDDLRRGARDSAARVSLVIGSGTSPKCTAALLRQREEERDEADAEVGVGRDGSATAPENRMVAYARPHGRLTPARASTARRHHAHAARARRLPVGSRADARSRCGRSCSRRPTSCSTRSIAAIARRCAKSSATSCSRRCSWRRSPRKPATSRSATRSRRSRQAGAPPSARLHADGAPLADAGPALTPDEVVEKWEDLKAAERGGRAAGSRRRC